MVKNQLQYYNCIVSPGYLVVAEDPTFLCSVCGNGVVVLVWDKIRKSGGMIHCIYARKGAGEKASNYHAETAVAQLIHAMAGVQSSPLNLEAQLFGGGNLNGYSARRADRVVATVRKMLKKLKVKIVSEDLGGCVGRKIIFDTRSGDVMVIRTKRVRKTDWAPEYGVQGR
jgi:chemotaxis protein CheD